MRPPSMGSRPSFGANSGPLNRGQGPMGNGGSGRMFGRDNAMTHANSDRAYDWNKSGGMGGGSTNRLTGRDNAMSHASDNAGGLYDTVFDQTAAANPFADGFDPTSWEERMAQMKEWLAQNKPPQRPEGAPELAQWSPTARPDDVTPMGSVAGMNPGWQPGMGRPEGAPDLSGQLMSGNLSGGPGELRARLGDMGQYRR